MVLPDSVMLGVYGIDFSRRIREEHHDLPVGLVSINSPVPVRYGTCAFELTHIPVHRNFLHRAQSQTSGRITVQGAGQIASRSMSSRESSLAPAARQTAKLIADDCGTTTPGRIPS